MAGVPLATSARNTLGNTTTFADPLDPSALAVTTVLPAPSVRSVAVAGPDAAIGPTAVLELVQSKAASPSVSPATSVSGAGFTTIVVTAATATMVADAD